MNIKTLAFLCIAASLFCIVSSAQAMVALPATVTVTATPNDQQIDCPNGCLEAQDSCVVADYVDDYVQTWTYTITINAKYLIQNYSDYSIDSLLISYSSLGDCRKLASTSWVSSSAGPSIDLDSSTTILGSSLSFEDGMAILTYETNNAFPVGTVGHDKHTLSATLNFTLSDYTYASYGSASGYDCVPEPSTLLLIFSGLSGLLAISWRKRK